MKKIVTNFIFLCFLVGLFFLNSQSIYAVTDTTIINTGGGSATAKDTTTVAPSVVKLVNPLTDVDDLRDLVGKIISTVLGIVGSLALLMFVYGGLIWMTAVGNEERIKKGRAILLWAVIGMVVIFTSYTVLQFVVGIFGAT